MSKGALRNLKPLFFVLLLTGCQIDLYKALSEQEANQMLALLMINQVAAKKVQESAGTVKITVAQGDFVNAVEVLRQNGYPRRHYHSVNDLFPAGQLVTSPAQELSKITYLKEQRLEQMLSSMEGVVSASVAIAEPPPAQNRREVLRPSAAVLVKHSPESNMTHFINQIKSLVHNSVPGLNYNAITVVLQPTNYRFSTPLLLATQVKTAPVNNLRNALKTAGDNTAQLSTTPPAKNAPQTSALIAEDAPSAVTDMLFGLFKAHGVLLLGVVWLLVSSWFLVVYLLNRRSKQGAEHVD